MALDYAPTRPGRVTVGTTRLVYFAPADLEIPRVDRNCIMRFCDALADAGCDVEAVALKIRVEHDEPSLHMSLRDVYGLRSDFAITLLRCGLRQDGPTFVAGLGRLLRYPIYAAKQLRRTRSERLVFYFKNPMLMVPFAFLRAITRFSPILAFELHTFPNSRMRRALVGAADLIVSNHETLASDLLKVAPQLAEKVQTLHQGVDLETFDRQRVDPRAARRELGLPLDDTLVVYTGKLAIEWKEVEYLVEAAANFAPGVTLVLVGGRADQLSYFHDRMRSSNVILTGFVEPARVHLYQLAADMLVSYYTYDKPLLRYVSPGKLFEYMAAQRALVCADHPALRTIIDDSQAAFVPPEQPLALAETVNQLASDPARRELLARNAYRAAGEYTWSSRAERFLSWLEHRAPVQNRPAASRRQT